MRPTKPREEVREEFIQQSLDWIEKLFDDAGELVDRSQIERGLEERASFWRDALEGAGVDPYARETVQILLLMNNVIRNLLDAYQGNPDAVLVNLINLGLVAREFEKGRPEVPPLDVAEKPGGLIGSEVELGEPGVTQSPPPEAQTEGEGDADAP